MPARELDARLPPSTPLMFSARRANIRLSVSGPCFCVLAGWQDFGESRYGGEPIFVPKSQDAEEGEGYLIVLVCKFGGKWRRVHSRLLVSLLCTGARPSTTNVVPMSARQSV